MNKHHKKNQKAISDIFKKEVEKKELKAVNEAEKEVMESKVADFTANSGQAQETKSEGDIEWKAPEFEYEPKTVSWYWVSIIVSIILIAIALWQRNFLFVVFIVICELLLIYFSNQYPKIWDFKINDEGISIGTEKFYKFENILGFDIHEAGDNYKELIIHTDLKLNPYIKIFIASDDEKKIEEKLLKFIKREEIPVSLMDALDKIVRF